MLGKQESTIEFWYCFAGHAWDLISKTESQKRQDIRLNYVWQVYFRRVTIHLIIASQNKWIPKRWHPLQMPGILIKASISKKWPGFMLNTWSRGRLPDQLWNNTCKLNAYSRWSHALDPRFSCDAVETKYQIMKYWLTIHFGKKQLSNIVDTGQLPTLSDNLPSRWRLLPDHFRKSVVWIYTYKIGATTGTVPKQSRAERPFFSWHFQQTHWFTEKRRHLKQQKRNKERTTK